MINQVRLESLTNTLFVLPGSKNCNTCQLQRYCLPLLSASGETLAAHLGAALPQEVASGCPWDLAGDWCRSTFSEKL